VRPHLVNSRASAVLSAFADGRLFGVRTGDGPPKVLALHGWRGSHAQMLPALAGIDAIALDLPGFGASPPPPTGWGAQDYAELVSVVLAELPDPPVVLGYSFGGRVAVHLAASYREHVRSLVLTGAPLIREKGKARPSLGYRLARSAHRAGVLSDARMEAIRNRRGSDDYRAADGVMREVFVRVVNESYESQLRATTCPVELVYGEDDTAAPVVQARRAADLLAQARLTVVPGGTHWSVVDHPDALRAVIDRVLA